MLRACLSNLIGRAAVPVTLWKAPMPRQNDGKIALTVWVTPRTLEGLSLDCLDDAGQTICTVEEAAADYLMDAAESNLADAARAQQADAEDLPF